MATRITDEQKESAKILAANSATGLSVEQIMQIFAEEWVYWHEAEFEDETMSAAQIIALGAMSNVLGRIAMSGKDL